MHVMRLTQMATPDKVLRQSRLKYLIFAGLIVIFIGYTVSAYLYSFTIIEYNDGLWWRSTPQGSLFPIPYGSGMLMALSPVSSLDAFIYKYLLRIPALILIDVLVTALIWFKFIRRV
jgi:hypothetical protein